MNREVAENGSQTPKEKLIPELSEEQNRGDEMKKFPTGLPLEEDFSGDFQEHSAASHPTAMVEGSGDAAFTHASVLPPTVSPSDHTSGASGPEGSISTKLSSAVFPWDEFSSSAEGSGEQLVMASISVGPVLPTTEKNLPGTDIPFIGQRLGVVSTVVSEIDRRPVILPTAEAKSTEDPTGKDKVKASSTVSIDFPQTMEPAKLWSRQGVDHTRQETERTTSEEEVQAQTSFESFQSSSVPEPTTLYSQALTETEHQTTGDSTKKTYRTDRQIEEEGSPLVPMSTLDPKGIGLYTVPTQGIVKPDLFFTPVVTDSIPAGSIITDSLSIEEENLKPFPKVVRPTINELDTELLFSGLGSGEDVLSAQPTASGNFTEVEQVISTFYPQTSQMGSLTTSSWGDKMEAYERMKNVENEIQPDNTSKSDEAALNTSSLESLSEPGTEEPTTVPFSFTTDMEPPRHQTLRGTEEIQSSRKPAATEQVSNEQSSTAEMREAVTPSTVSPAGTSPLEMANEFVTAEPKPSDFLYESSGEGSGELDILDVVYTSGTTQATRPGSTTPVSDKFLGEHPEVSNAKTGTGDESPMMSTQLPLQSRQNESSPDPTSTLSKTESYERPTEEAADSVQDLFEGFKDSTLKPSRKKATENIIIDLDNEGLILTVTESPMPDILPVLRDTTTIIDIDHTKPVYEDILGMPTDVDSEVPSGPPGSDEETAPAQDKSEAAPNLSLTQGAFEGSGDPLVPGYTQTTPNESVTSETQSQLDYVGFNFATGTPGPSVETELDLFLPTITPLALPSKSAAANPETREPDNETNPLDDAFEASTLSDGQAIADQSEVLPTSGHSEGTKDEYEEKKQALPSFHPEFSSGSEEVSIGATPYVSIGNAHLLLQSSTGAPNLIGGSRPPYYTDTAVEPSSVEKWPSHTPPSPFPVYLGMGSSEPTQEPQASLLPGTEAGSSQQSPKDSFKEVRTVIETTAKESDEEI
ncbi:versican core protein-like [Ctenodactylus gundi]